MCGSADPDILETFHAYAKAFETLDPSAVLEFYHYPAVLVSEQKTVEIKNEIVGWLAFTIAMTQLKWHGYSYSETEALEVRQLRSDLAVITGTVIRFKKDKTELERFDLNYTMRKVNNNWKIIVGTLLEITDKQA